MWSLGCSQQAMGRVKAGSPGSTEPQPSSLMVGNELRLSYHNRDQALHSFPMILPWHNSILQIKIEEVFGTLSRSIADFWARASFTPLHSRQVLSEIVGPIPELLLISAQDKASQDPGEPIPPSPLAETHPQQSSGHLPGSKECQVSSLPKTCRQNYWGWRAESQEIWDMSSTVFRVEPPGH